MKKVGILRGGMGKENKDYHSSLKRGGEIISHLHEHLADKYKPVDIFLDQEGAWHIAGVPSEPADLLHKVDLVWNSAHSSLSNVLNNFSIPNVGSSPFSANLEGNRESLEKHLKKVGVAMPRHLILPAYNSNLDGPRERYSIRAAKKVFEKFGSPWLVRALSPHAHMGVHLAMTFDELVGAIEDGVNHEQSLLVEEFIVGRVSSVHSVANFRDQDIYTFPPTDIFGKISGEEKEKLSELSRTLHQHIGAEHYSKCVYVVNKRGKIFLIHLDLSPNLTKNSSLHEVCERVGAKAHHVIEHIIDQAFY